MRRDNDRRPVTVYRASTTDAATKLAYAGSLITWGLDNPETSARWLFGASGAKASGAYKVRHLIYSALRAHQGEPDLSIAAIATALKDRCAERSILTQLPLLKHLRVLDISTDMGHNPKIIINRDIYAGKIKLSETRPETQAAYRAIQRLGKGTTTTVNDIIAKALEIDPAIDSAALRKKLLRGAKGFASIYPGLEIAEPPTGQRSSVRFSPEAAGPIADLYDRFEAVEHGNRTKTQSYVRAAERLGSHQSARTKADFKTLIMKGRNTCDRAIKREQLDQRLSEVVASLGAVCADEAAKALFDRYPDANSLPSVNTVRLALHRLADSGSMTVELEPRRHSRQNRLVFRPAQSK